jgi:hypothetical protein
MFEGLLNVCSAGTCGSKNYATGAGELYVEGDIESDAVVFAWNFYDTTGFFNDGSTAGLCWGNAGGSYIRDCNGAPSDYAEWYRAENGYGLDSGDIVVAVSEKDDLFDKNFAVAKASLSQGSSIVGVVSTEPNVIIGEDVMPEELHNSQDPVVFADGKQYVAVALAGRVPVKVNAENGPISVGDRITISSADGQGMRLDESESGPVIGKALESMTESEGTILIFIEPGYYTAPKDSEIAAIRQDIDHMKNVLCVDHPAEEFCS